MLEDTPGTRIGNETYSSLSAAAKIHPLRDQVVIEPLDWEPSKTIKVVYTGKPLRGTVRAIGPGHYKKFYNGPKGKRSKTWDSKYFTPSDLKVGDIVELGGLELRGYLFQTFRWGGKQMIICREADVAIVYD